MIVVNADDWGRSVAETNAAEACFKARRITSVTAMVFMDDSVRAASLAREGGLRVGLHLNFSQPYSSRLCPSSVLNDQDKVVKFLTGSKYASVVFNPALHGRFRATYIAQCEEFERLYGARPTHLDGHHHKHLCANVIWGAVIPPGSRVRRNFTYRRGEKGWLNRSYRSIVDFALKQKYVTTDHLVSLGEALATGSTNRLVELSEDGSVEVMTHPIVAAEYDYLMSDEFERILDRGKRGDFSQV